jgi:NADH-quinone oxidoreductase subunit N
MTSQQIIALLPFIVLGAASLIVLLAVAIHRHHELTLGLTVLGLLLTLGSLGPAAGEIPIQVTPLFTIDGYALFYTGLFALASLAVVLLAYGYYRHRSGNHEELYVLILIAALGAVTLGSSTHFASLFLGIELLSISLIALAAYAFDHPRPLEAGIKYLVMSGASSAVLLFGIALIYAAVGSLDLRTVGAYIGNGPQFRSPYMVAGLGMFISGLAFKIFLVPFHLWTPDVYEGAPAPVTAFLATVSKGAVAAVLLRFFVGFGGAHSPALSLMLAMIAGASMLIGNLLALLQNNVKRILAYSSIAHMGYFLVAVVAGGAFALEAGTFYITAYVIMTLGAFGIVAVLSAPHTEADMDTLENYQGLYWRRPWLAGSFTVMLLSLAGIPITVGFMGKFYLFVAGLDAKLLSLVVTLIVGSVIGLFYYLRIIVAMAKPPEGASVPHLPAGLLTGGGVIAVLTVILIGLGVYPTALVNAVHAATVPLIH